MKTLIFILTLFMFAPGGEHDHNNTKPPKHIFKAQVGSITKEFPTEQAGMAFIHAKFNALPGCQSGQLTAIKGGYVIFDIFCEEC